MPLGLRGRRTGTGPAVASAVALHVVCLGALLGLEYSRTAQPPLQEAVIELAVISLPISEAVVPPPPEPVEAAAAVPETTSPPALELGPAPVEAPPPLPSETPHTAPEPVAAAEPAQASVAVAPAPPPAETVSPLRSPTPAQPVRAPSRPHAAAMVPRPAAVHQDNAASGAPASPAAAPPVAPALRSTDQEAALETRIRDAVQAAVHYPASARMMGVIGRARVLLDYRSGSVAGPTLTQSSGTPLLDEAALTAARTARYPPAPAEIEGRLLRLLVWVEFKPG